MEADLEFTEKEISPWGGMGLMKRLLDRIGFEQALRGCGLPQPGRAAAAMRLSSA
ncbi:MAG: hypothetical protein M0Z84_09215 [Gammaproteobacteria bacterium]|nr:hypothetical protein [Rhodospirillales bacterium]MDA8363977.1 hypothetical protein [Gammaproteobacteria bacterium]